MSKTLTLRLDDVQSAELERYKALFNEKTSAKVIARLIMEYGRLNDLHTGLQEQYEDTESTLQKYYFKFQSLSKLCHEITDITDITDQKDMF
jgi:hypothetical protein